MNAIVTPFVASSQLVHFRLPHLFSSERRRRQATIDLIHASPHLLRDIGASEGMVRTRRP